MVSSKEVEFMVLQYACRDTGMVPALGKSCFQWTWLVCVGGGSVLDLKLTVDTHLIGCPEVNLTLGETSIFPGPGSSSKAKLTQDLQWQCPFRGLVSGIGERRKFEMRPEHGAADVWYPATINQQRPDGLFEVVAFVPNGEKEKEVTFPAVRQEFLREATGMKAQVKPQMRTLVLTVPMKDPANSTLAVEGLPGNPLMTHFFARWSPPPVKDVSGALAAAQHEPPRIRLSVNQNRSLVTFPVGHTYLEHFLNGQVRQHTIESSSSKATWTLQIGPFAMHTVEVEKLYKLSSAITVTVDKHPLVEAPAEDLESPEGTWECTFRLVGARFIDWDVHEQTSAGVNLPTKCTVSHKLPFIHECKITIPADPLDIQAARLSVDGKDFDSLPIFKEVPTEKSLSLEPEAMKGSYGLEAPVQYGTLPPSGFGTFMANCGIHCGTNQGLFCCGANAVDHNQHDTMVNPARMDPDEPGIMDPKLIYPVLGLTEEPRQKHPLDAEGEGFNASQQETPGPSKTADEGTGSSPPVLMRELMPSPPSPWQEETSPTSPKANANEPEADPPETQASQEPPERKAAKCKCTVQ